MTTTTQIFDNDIYILYRIKKTHHLKSNPEALNSLIEFMIQNNIEYERFMRGYKPKVTNSKK